MENYQNENGSGLNRRTFLKATGLAAIGSALDAAADPMQVGPSHKPASQSATAKSRVEMVNLLQGTNSTRVFSRGNTLPIAALPFGMAHWTIQSRSNTPWMFHPDDRRIQGFRCTHQLSPWLSDYGQAIILPICGSPKPTPELRASSWRPEEATLYPYSLRLFLARYQIDAELVPTERCAVLTANIAGEAPAGFLVEVPDPSASIQPGADDRTIRFKSTANEGGVPKNFATYYVIRFAGAWETFELHDSQENRIAVVYFPSSKRRVEARIATSFISYEQAERNLARELGTTPVEELRKKAATHWEEHFNRISPDGGSEEQQRIFSSCLYRALLFPRMWHEPDINGNPHHFSPYNGKVLPGVMYADHGYWDVYRAWYPLMSIVFPERLAEILQAWMNASTEGGWMPQFPCPGYRACMTGSLIDAVFADAAVKGICNFDLMPAYESLKKHATQSGDPDHGYGRRGLEQYLRLGYVPADRVSQSVAETADAAYGDFCIAQVAKVVGRDADAAMFLERSRNWRNLFDPVTNFLRGKNEDGHWVEPFDQYAWGSPYVEGSAWQHRWDVPHDLAALIEAMGGSERSVGMLDEMLSQSPIFHVGVYGQEIHEMSEMAAANFGQYAHSNQPVHHLLYIYAAAGKPEKTQHWVRRVLSELYTVDTFPGDEDTGSMAAWYILSAMGLYPLCPGKPEYVIGSPLFDRVTLLLPGAKKMMIEARGQSARATSVSKLLINGTAHTATTISHDVIAQGGHMTYYMQTPSS